jgi:hypothetical protein
MANQMRVRLSDEAALGLVHQIKHPGKPFDIDAKKKMYQEAVPDLVRAVNELDNRAAEARDQVLEVLLPGEAMAGFPMVILAEKVEKVAKLVKMLEFSLEKAGLTVSDITALNDGVTVQYRTSQRD